MPRLSAAGRTYTPLVHVLGEEAAHATSTAAERARWDRGLMITLRVRTKDGMERLKVDKACQFAALRELISSQLGVPLEQQVQRPMRPSHASPDA